MISFTEKRTIIATVEPQNQDSFDLNDFLSLFVDKNPFAYLSSFVFGIIPLNAQAKQYSVFFKTGNDTVMQELLQRFQYSQNIETLSHRIVKISFSKPKPPPQTVTLWPVSHEMTFDMLKNLVEGNRWGKMLNFAYGRHKLFPQFHNAYLHLHIDNYSPNSVPDKITVNNSTVMVIKPGEGNVLRCNFCKNKGHSLTSCPQKRQRSQHPSKRSNPIVSYSAIVNPQNDFPPLTPSSIPKNTQPPVHTIKDSPGKTTSGTDNAVLSNGSSHSSASPHNMAPASRTISVSKAGNSQQGNSSPIKSNNKPKDHNSKNLALRPQSDENLSDYKDSEVPPVDNDIVAGSKTESSPMDTTKLQRLLNEQSFISEKSSASNAGLQTLKDSSLPQDCPEPDFPANLEKLSQLSATEATHSLSSDSCESSSLTAIEELFNVVFKEQTATTNTNNKLHFGADAPVFSDSLSSEEDSKPISELLKIKTSKGTWQTKNQKKRKYKSRESNSPSGLTPPNKIEHKQFTNPNEKTILNK